MFGIRVGVSINLLVKTGRAINRPTTNDSNSVPTRIFYYRTDDLWNKKQKFNFLNECEHIGDIDWQIVQPDARHTWLTEGLHTEFETFIPMGTKKTKAAKGEVVDVIFKIYSCGVVTCRDAWAYNFNRNTLSENMSGMIDTYNEQMFKWAQRANRDANVDEFVLYDNTKISWSETLKRNLQRGKTANFSQEEVRNSLYRPFTKSNLYFDRMMTERVYVFPSIFPIPKTEAENRVIIVSDHGFRAGFNTLMTNLIPDCHILAARDRFQCFPFYIYSEDGGNRRENITDWALEQFRGHYRDEAITKWDIFHYVYGLLHHPNYRERYEANLKRDLPRLPYTPDFWGFAKAGQRLGEIHIDYEEMEEYQLTLIETPGKPLDWRVEKMRLSKDKAQIKYNDFLTLDGIPAKAFDYRLGNRSALEWVIDQYRVKTDKRSGIVNDPNRVDDPEYIVRLIGKVITVSLETVEIVEGAARFGGACSLNIGREETSKVGIRMGEEEIMSIYLDQKGLSLAQMLEYMRCDLKLTDMIIVYSDRKELRDYGIYCALIPSRQVDQVLAKSSWDLSIGHGMPGTTVNYKSEEEQVEYLRYGADDGVEPLIINRDFNESQTNYRKRVRYNEISEEFRFFHNLYHDREKEEYIKIDDEGNEHIVAAVEPDCIQIRLKEIRQFLAVKDMYLSIQFSFQGDLKYSSEELGVSEDEMVGEGKTKPIRQATADGDICWWHWQHRGYNDIRMLEGKRLIEPLPKSQSVFPGFAEEPKCVEFIIDVDGNGDEINHTSDAPHRMDPVYFHKQVLDKYYNKPSIYSVEDSRVSCPWWAVRLDNHHEDKVIVLLRDLSSLPYTEQQHWRTYNIPPEGGLSKTFFERYLKGSFTATSDRPEHLFKHRYAHLQKESEKYLGWQLLRPLDPRDEHHLKRLRVPSTNEQSDFDDLVLSLTKILIDSLNQKELKKLISPEQKRSLKGTIDCLKVALNSCGVEDAADHIAFLRNFRVYVPPAVHISKEANTKKLLTTSVLRVRGCRRCLPGFSQRLWAFSITLSFSCIAAESAMKSLSKLTEKKDMKFLVR